MKFFGTLSGILIILSFILFFPILLRFIKTGLVPNFPTLIVSGFIALTAILSLFTGFMLTTIVEKDRRDFEFKLYLVNHYNV